MQIGMSNSRKMDERKELAIGMEKEKIDERIVVEIV